MNRKLKWLLNLPSGEPLRYDPVWHWHVFTRAIQTSNYYSEIQIAWRELNYKLQKVRNSNPDFQKQFDYWSKLLGW
jgi:hypothetical protein